MKFLFKIHLDPHVQNVLLVPEPDMGSPYGRTDTDSAYKSVVVCYQNKLLEIDKLWSAFSSSSLRSHPWKNHDKRDSNDSNRDNNY